jgi:hypothetical protein
MTETVTDPLPSRLPRRISDLFRGAFWIYGVTAMVMREPLGLIVRHATDAGLGNWQVRLELLRVVVILLLLSRLFLASGLYFDEVFMQPDSADRFPRRSYPIDFLNGLLQFLAGAAATTVVGLHTRIFGGIAPFTLVLSLFLIVDWIWLVVAKLRDFSATGLIAANARSNAVILLAGAIGLVLARIATGDAVFADQTALALVALFTAAGIIRLIRAFERSDAA